jgi:rfaE bifunctional protein kinase chain/domain
MLLVMGDVMVDVLIDGTVDRISPDAPVPVLLRTAGARRMSGACISAQAARDATARDVAIAAVVGADEPAEFLRSELRRAGITPLLGTVARSPTIIKTRFRTGSHHLLRVDEDGAFAEQLNDVEAHMLDVWRTMRPRITAVLFTDYAKGALTEALVRQVIADARADGIKVVVDSKRRDVSCYAGATVWTPNEHEFVAVSGGGDPQASASHMREQLGLDAVIVTCAARGAMLMGGDGDCRWSDAPTLERAVSVAGAGDVLAGVVTAMAADGAGWSDALAEGVLRATRFVGRHPEMAPLP